MSRRILGAHDQVDLLAPWRTAAPIWQKVPSDLSWGEELDPDLGNDKPLTHRKRQPDDEPTGKWYHVSTQPLKPGTKVVPRGGPSPDSDYYNTDETGYDNTNRQNHVWLAPSLARAYSWSSNLNAPYIHEVKPGDKPQPWNFSGTNGWVAPHAHVVRQVPREEGKQAETDYYNSTRYHPGGHTEILPGGKWASNNLQVRHIDPFDVSDEADRAAGLFGDGDEPLSQLAWRHGGEVAMVATPEQHRGNGHATTLFNHVKTHLEPNLHHSPHQTPEGASWAKQAMPAPIPCQNCGRAKNLHGYGHQFGPCPRPATSRWKPPSDYVSPDQQRKQADVMPYLRNNNGMRDQAASDDFGQQVEPWGRYMSGDADVDGEHPPLQQGWERGTVGFDNPLYVPHDYGSWKQSLSQAHGGLTGKALTQALTNKGHDGIITHDKYGIGEMVDLRPKGQRGHRTASRWFVADGGPGNSDEDLNGSTSYGDDRHPDLLASLFHCGCVHTHGGRRLPIPRTAAAATDFTGPQDTTFNGFDDPAGWTYHKSFEPSQVARQGASAYAALSGTQDPHDGRTDYLNTRRTPESLKAVAQNYDSLPMHDPAALKHFDAMKRDTLAQHDFMTNKLGIKTQVTDHDPYNDVHEMLDDVNNNKRLQVLGTHVTGGHPYLDDTTNDKFRAVHDFFGHAATGRSFDRHGEQAAYLAHSQMFSPAARPALATETRGQNSSLVLNGGFQPQKTAILHPQFWSGNSPMHLSKGDPSYLKDGKCKYCKSPATKSILHSEGMAYVQTCDKHFGKGRKDAEACVPFGEPDPGNIDKVYDLATKKVIGVRRMGRQIISARDQVAMLEPWLAMRKGAPFAGYEDFDDCTSQNGDKDRPDAYCGEIKHRTEDKTGGLQWYTAAPAPEGHFDEAFKSDLMKGIDDPQTGGGFTLRDRPGDGPRSDFMVSLPTSEGHEEQTLSRPEVNGDNQTDYINRKWDTVHARPDQYAGGWDEGGPWYNDVSRHVQDPRDAAELALSGGQKAVYDLDHDEEVSTPDMVNRATAPGIGLQGRRRRR